MSSDLKPVPWYRTIEAIWPVIVFGIATIIWMIEAQTVSHSSFDSLQTRVTIIENNTPDKKTMAAIEANQAVMKHQLAALTINVSDLLAWSRNDGWPLSEGQKK